jgi:hypothetical protein
MYRTNQVGPHHFIDPSAIITTQDLTSSNVTTGGILKPLILNTSSGNRVAQTNVVNANFTAGGSVSFGVKLSPLTKADNIFVTFSGVCCANNFEADEPETIKLLPVIGTIQGDNTPVVPQYSYVPANFQDANTVSLKEQVCLMNCQHGGIDVGEEIFVGFVARMYGPVHANSFDVSISAMYNLADVTTRSGLY